MDVYHDCSSCNVAHPMGHHEVLQRTWFRAHNLKRPRQQTSLLPQVPGELLQSNYPVDGDRLPTYTKLSTQPAMWPRCAPTSPGSIWNRRVWVGPGKLPSHMETALLGTAFCTGEYTEGKTHLWKEHKLLLFLFFYLNSAFFFFFFFSPLLKIQLKVQRKAFF